MSYDYENSENYLSDGVYANWWTWEDDDYIEARKRESKEHLLIKKQLSLKWLRSIDDPNYNACDLLNVIFKNTVQRGCIFALKRYCRLESIQQRYAHLISKGCKPADIIVSKLAKYNLFMGVDDMRRLDLTIEDLREYRNDLTAYFKVHELQLLIHREMQIKNGVNSHLAMDIALMREVLSSLRLFFLNDETKKMDLDGFVNFTSRYKNVIKNMGTFTPKYSLESSKYSENWSLNHQHSLLYYFPKEMREFVRELVLLRSEKYKKKIHDRLKSKITSYHLQI
tara:strand:+ start:4376 stop:5221 length:846 start_codon:yes stop_codon:yes gene_type:complete